MAMSNHTTLTVRRGNEVIGHVSHGHGCNRHCKAAMAEGRHWHATPMGFAITLADYHYASRDDAVAAIERAMLRVPGRKPDLAVGEDHEWRLGRYGGRQHAKGCAAYRERAEAVREAVLACQVDGPMAPAHTDQGLAQALSLVANSGHPQAPVWEGVLREYQSDPDGDQFADACDCGAWEVA